MRRCLADSLRIAISSISREFGENIRAADLASAAFVRVPSGQTASARARGANFTYAMKS